MDVGAVLARLKREYPLPKISPEWVSQCSQALVEAGEEATYEAILEQYLYSDLSISTLPSNLIPQGESHNTILFPKPTLLQILFVTEIGSSAFQLNTVLEQRRDVFDGVTRIRRIDEVPNGTAAPVGGGEVDGNGEDNDDNEGNLPKYPRGMLSLEITDGRVIVKAMEYRRIPDLMLGETCLGAKLLVHNVKVLRGILLLSPENTRVLGYSVEHLEDQQPVLFVNSLQKRMGKPPIIEMEEGDGGQVELPTAANTIQAVQPARPRPRADPLPTSPPQRQSRTAGTSTGAEARRAAMAAAFAKQSTDQAPPPNPNTSSSSSTKPRTKSQPKQSPYFQAGGQAGPSRSQPQQQQQQQQSILTFRKLSPPSNIEFLENEKKTPIRPTRKAGTQASKSIKRLYDTIPEIFDAEKEYRLENGVDSVRDKGKSKVTITTKVPVRGKGKGRKSEPIEIDDESFWDDDEPDRGFEKGNKDDTFDMEFDEMDIQALEKVERKAKSGTTNISGSKKKRVIELDDNEEEEGEEADETFYDIDESLFLNIPDLTPPPRKLPKSTKSGKKRRVDPDEDDEDDDEEVSGMEDKENQTPPLIGETGSRGKMTKVAKTKKAVKRTTQPPPVSSGEVIELSSD